ncbi:MAG: zinc ribbon domain-containing protein [Clostridia bacterium]|nr:zinc ribbon domain-containing protein [Clostridia bacterium]
MYCPNCGKEIAEETVICPHCGVQIKNVKKDEPNTLLKVVSFIFPIIGLIIYLVMMDDEPKSAKAYGKMALIGFVVGIALFFFLLMFLFLASGLGASLFDWIRYR